MRLMLGYTVDGKDTPQLLVDVHDDFDIKDFGFKVVNGGWFGHYTDGVVTISNHYTGLDSISPILYKILSNNQDRLRGHYQTVFENFNNQNYVAIGIPLVPFEYSDSPPLRIDNVAF